jgi:hypothetical protein
VLRTAGETETMQENIQVWLQLDEGDPGFQLLAEEEITAVIFLYLFSSALHVLLNFPFICFIRFFLYGYFINPDCLLIRITSPWLIRISEGLLYLHRKCVKCVGCRT